MTGPIQLDTERLILSSKYLPSEIQHRKCLDINEQAAVVGVPPTTLEKVYREAGSPPLFTVGRHRLCLYDDLIDWLKRRRETHPYVRGPARNAAGRRGKN